jgi:hypothetical protein
MIKSTSRRGVLRIAARTAAIAAAAAGGLIPESQLAIASGHSSANGRTFVLTRAKGAARAARLAQAVAGSRGRVAAAFLAREGFTPAPIDGEVSDLSWSDGEHVGRLDVAVFRSADGRYARLIQQEVGPHQVTGVSLFTAAKPERREVFELRDGRMVPTATLTGQSDGSIEILEPNGRRTHVAPRPDRASASKGPGLASVQAGIYCTAVCTWTCSFVCDWVCTTVLVETCVISTACGPLVFVCAGACIVAVIASCAFNCSNYCGWACETSCTYLEG